MKLFWHEIVSLGCFPGFVSTRILWNVFLYRIQKKQSGMKSNPISYKIGLKMLILDLLCNKSVMLHWRHYCLKQCFYSAGQTPVPHFYRPVFDAIMQSNEITGPRRGSSPKFDRVLLNLKRFWSPQSGEKNSFRLLGGSGGMLPQKSLKIEALKSPEIAFQGNLLRNFFTIT